MLSNGNHWSCCQQHPHKVHLLNKHYLTAERLHAVITKLIRAQYCVSSLKIYPHHNIYQYIQAWGWLHSPPTGPNSAIFHHNVIHICIHAIKWCNLRMKRSQCGKGVCRVNSMCMILHYCIVVHSVGTFTTSCLSTCTNQLAGKETRNFICHITCKTCKGEGKKPETDSTTSVTMIWTIPSSELSCLANCRPLHISFHCRLFSLSKMLMFMPVASAMTAIHSDHWVLPSNAQWPEVQLFVSWGQTVSADLL